MKKIICFLFFFCALTAAVKVSADTTADGPDLRPLVCIDADKIVNKTSVRRANFSGLVDRLTHELVQCGIYRVMTMKDFAATLVDNEKFAVAADDGGKGTKTQTPAYSIRLTVTAYGISNEKGKDVLYGNVGLNAVASVEFILTLVDGRSGQTLKSANISSTKVAQVQAIAGERKRGNYDQIALQAACKDASQKVVRELLKFTPFYVLDVNGQQVMIDAPASVAPAGSTFDIFKLGRAIRNRRTGKVIRRETRICTIRITNPGEDGSTGVIFQLYTNDPVKTDYIARPAEVPAAAVQAPAQSAPAPSVAAPF